MGSLESPVPSVGGRFSLPYAAAAAFIVEALLLSTLAVGLSDAKKTEVPERQPVMISLPAVPVAPPPLRKPVKPAPRPMPAPVHHAVRHSVPPAQKTEPPRALPEPLAMAPAAPDSVPAPPRAEPVRQAAPPQPPRSDPGIQARFEDQVRSAVQSAMRYPYAAKLAHISGRTQISFEYLNGRVSAARISISSGYDMLDNAALQAVSAAAYPPPPKNQMGRTLPFKVWVRFYLTDSSAD